MHRAHLHDETGQTMAEYGVILAVMSAAVISALIFFSDGIRSGFLKAVEIMTGG